MQRARFLLEGRPMTLDGSVLVSPPFSGIYKADSPPDRPRARERIRPCTAPQRPSRPPPPDVPLNPPAPAPDERPTRCSYLRLYYFGLQILIVCWLFLLFFANTWVPRGFIPSRRLPIYYPGLSHNRGPLFF